MIIDESIKVKDYKCFGSDPQGFDKIYTVNIIIGKNNSGKSSLIDLIEYVIAPQEKLINTGRGRTRAEVIITHVLQSEEIQNAVSEVINKASVAESIFKEDLKSANNKFDYRLHLGLIHLITKVDRLEFQDAIEHSIRKPFYKKLFRRINAERDIRKEDSNDKRDLLSNGENATSFIRRSLNNVKYDLNLIKKELLKSINTITNPEIHFQEITTREDNGIWEIYFEDNQGSWVALSNMGSGIKTILLVLLNLIVIPNLEKMEFTDRQYSDYIFGFEELENNLHPSMQRRLFNFIREYAEKNSSYFFITTHSNVVIDLFGNDPLAQILHVQKQGDHSIVNSISPQKHKDILSDLDFKPSDLLLSNGIVWVEGPSDAIYLELLLKLYGKKSNFSELDNFSYTIQSLSTAIWKYVGFSDFKWDDVDLQNKIISLAKLNHNHLIVIDNDGNYDDKKPSEWEQFSNGTGQNKAKLIYESLNHNSTDELMLETNFGDAKENQLLFWINDGTFETYLEFFIENKGAGFAKYFDSNKSGYLEKKREGENSSISKVILASDIAKFCLQNNLSLDDIAPMNFALLNKITRLYNTIKSWN